MNPHVTLSVCCSRLVPNGLLAICLLFPVSALRAQSTDQVKPLAENEPADVASDKVIQLDAFKVTAAIETYHQATSSMATKLPMELKEIPSSLSILNTTAISDRNAVTLLDVVNYVVGANQTQNNINGFTFRGFNNAGSFTQNIQFDGLQGATLKKAATSAANVDSMEFLKGPNGVLYGQMNPGGLLNIVTKSPKEKRETNVRLTAGFYEGEFTTFGHTITKTASFDTTGPVFNSKHLFYRLVVDGGSSPTSRPGNYAKNISIYPSLTYKWSPQTYFTAKFEASRDYRRQDTNILPIFTNNTAFGDAATFVTAPLNTVYNDSTDQAVDYGRAASTVFHSQFGEWQLRFQSRSVWHVDEVREYTINNANVFSPTATFATPTTLLRRQYNHLKNGHRYNYLDANIFRDFTLGKVKSTVIFGTGGGWEEFYAARLAFGPNQTLAQAITLINPRIDQVPAYPADGTGKTDTVTDLTALGEYVSDQMKIGDRLHVSLGLRHDHQFAHGLNRLLPSTTEFTNIQDAFTKQAGTVYDFSPSISGYASWSQSIKPQTSLAFDATGHADFPPESGEQYEIGVKFETPNKNANISLAAYEITRSNVLVPSGTNFTVATGNAQVGQQISRLDGEQQSRGIELEVQYQPVPNWQLQAGFAYSKAIITVSEKNPATVGLDLANAPRVSGNFWTRYNFPRGQLKGLGAGLGYVYSGKSWAGDPTTTVYFPLKAWNRVDSSLYYKWKRYNFSLNIQNLLDRRNITSAQSSIVLIVGEQRKLTFSVGTSF